MARYQEVAPGNDARRRYQEVALGNGVELAVEPDYQETPPGNGPWASKFAGRNRQKA